MIFQLIFSTSPATETTQAYREACYAGDEYHAWSVAEDTRLLEYGAHNNLQC
jgi:hypothetical protein